MNTQLSLRTAGITPPTKKARALNPSGNMPVIVIDTKPAYDSVLGAICKAAGEKSRTVTACAKLMLSTGDRLVL